MDLDIRQGTHGRGAFAPARIPKGTQIFQFTGPLLRYADTTADTLALQIGPDLYIGESGQADDCVNHSCEPNAAVRIVGTSAFLDALRDIAAGEEIFFDYSTIMAEADYTMKCLCGTASCRGTVGDGRDLPQAVWDRYLAMGILSDHVVRSKREGRIR
jgi:uncharacterized protein